MTVHNPAEIPDVAEEFVLIPLDSAVVGTITPRVMKTQSDVRNYSPQERRCYFEEEKKLLHFKTYNQENCLLECRTNSTLKWCGCVEFYMPRKLVIILWLPMSINETESLYLIMIYF